MDDLDDIIGILNNNQSSRPPLPDLRSRGASQQPRVQGLQDLLKSKGDIVIDDKENDQHQVTLNKRPLSQGRKEEGKEGVIVGLGLEKLDGVVRPISKKYLIFRPYIDPISLRPYKPADRGYYFKFHNGADIKLIRYTMEDNGFRETSTRHQEWSLLWSCSNLKSNVYQSLTRYQKVNHFPKSTEITRKDQMYVLISRMRELYGQRHFGFVPLTYILPNGQGNLAEQMRKNPSQMWIVKPAASCQGKGIFLTNSVADIPPKQQMIASEYIANPLLVDGYKFDLRVYVGVTSINPLRIYIYEEGLTRFATAKYNQDNKKGSNKYTHLTNYSLNKFNANFMNNVDAEVDDQGSKWSLSALRKKLRLLNIDDIPIFKKIDDIIIKTIIAGENVMNNAVDMFVPFKKNCFQVFGFDILIDSCLEPWLLEVNLSPSLNCDSPLDQKIKGHMLADLLSLVGIVALDQRTASDANARKQISIYTGKGLADIDSLSLLMKKKKQQKRVAQVQSANTLMQGTRDERTALKDTEEEQKRGGLFKRVFPCQDYPYYRQFFDEDRPLNHFLDQKLYGHLRNVGGAAKANEKNPSFLGDSKMQQPKKQPNMSSDRLVAVKTYQTTTESEDDSKKMNYSSSFQPPRNAHTLRSHASAGPLKSRIDSQTRGGNLRKIGSMITQQTPSHGLPVPSRLT